MVESPSSGAAVPTAKNPTEARKRRKAIITQQRNDDPPSSAPSSTAPPLSNGSVRLSKDSPQQSEPNDAAADEEGGRKASKRDESSGESNADGLHERGENPGERRRNDAGDEWDNDCDDGSETSDAGMEMEGFGKRLNKKRGQIRYDPDVPMSKDQLALWRRECRRVRNRESAAASRARVRNRIQELEGEVEDWKAKYAQAVQRLEHLQHAQSTSAAQGSM